jgi:hypothetical protein
VRESGGAARESRAEDYPHIRYFYDSKLVVQSVEMFPC